MDGMRSQNPFFGIGTTKNPTEVQEISDCRENCGDICYTCATATCKDDDDVCQRMCITDFRSCYDACVSVPKPEPIQVAPPDAFFFQQRNLMKNT